MKANTVLAENAYNYILDEILKGRIQPGERIREDEIADEMGTSRTPVREAVNQLSQNGFIKYIKRKGLYCVQYNRDELESLLELRETLEEFSYIHCANMAKKEDIERLQNIIKQFNSLPDQEKEKQHQGNVLSHRTDLLFSHSITVIFWIQWAKRRFPATKAVYSVQGLKSCRWGWSRRQCLFRWSGW